MRIWKPNSADTIRTCTRLATETLRDRNIRSGSNGAAAVACRRTNPASRATAAAKRPSVRADTQPKRVVSTIA